MGLFGNIKKIQELEKRIQELESDNAAKGKTIAQMNADAIALQKSVSKQVEEKTSDLRGQIRDLKAALEAKKSRITELEMALDNKPSEGSTLIKYRGMIKDIIGMLTSVNRTYATKAQKALYDAIDSAEKMIGED